MTTADARAGIPVDWMVQTNDGPPPLPAEPPRESSRFAPGACAPFVAIATLTFVADALSKMWAVLHLEVHGHGAMSVVPGHLDFIVARNPGAAFSLLRDAPESLRRPFFVVVTIVACAVAAVTYKRLHASRFAARAALALVLGGALGNLVDRIRDGVVVDFVQAHARLGGSVEHYWPTFNVADIAICAGAVLLLVDGMRRRRAVA
jgi:lipoprotein signal peptidase